MNNANEGFTQRADRPVAGGQPWLVYAVMVKNLFILLLIACTSGTSALAQVSSTTRSPASYTQDVFAYKGSRILQVDEVGSPGNEENVFIFSKAEKLAKPDVLYFQRFTKQQGQWKLSASLEIRHEGVISVVGNRKTFTDTDKNKSIDAVFVYALNDMELKQQSIHLLLSHGSKIYTIAANRSDHYASSTYSANFSELSRGIQNAAIHYWNQLDKADK